MLNSDDKELRETARLEMEAVSRRAGTKYATLLADKVQNPTWVELTWLEAQKYEIDIRNFPDFTPPRENDTHILDFASHDQIREVYEWLKRENLSYLSHLCEPDGMTIKMSVKKASQQDPTIQNLLNSPHLQREIKSTRRENITQKTRIIRTGYHRAYLRNTNGLPSPNPETKNEYLLVDIKDNTKDEVQGWTWRRKSQENTWSLSGLGYLETNEYILFPTSVEPSGKEIHEFWPDTRRALGYIPKQWKTLKEHRLSRSSINTIRDTLTATRHEDETQCKEVKPPHPSKLNPPYGVNAYEDPTKSSTEANSFSPHVHTQVNALPRNLIVEISKEIPEEAFETDPSGEKTLIAYSDGSVKDNGRKGAGSWRVKGGSIQSTTREYPVSSPLTSTRTELMQVIRCLISLRTKWSGRIRITLDNKGVVSRFSKLKERAHKILRGEDGDLWNTLAQYTKGENSDETTTIRWVKGHADQDKGKYKGKKYKDLTIDEKENIKVGKQPTKHTKHQSTTESVFHLLIKLYFWRFP